MRNKYSVQINKIIKELQKITKKYKNKTLELDSIKYPNFTAYTTISLPVYKEYYSNKEKAPKSTPFYKKFVLLDAIKLLLPDSQKLMKKLGNYKLVKYDE